MERAIDRDTLMTIMSSDNADTQQQESGNKGDKTARKSSSESHNSRSNIVIPANDTGTYNEERTRSVRTGIPQQPSQYIPETQAVEESETQAVEVPETQKQTTDSITLKTKIRAAAKNIEAGIEKNAPVIETVSEILDDGLKTGMDVTSGIIDLAGKALQGDVGATISGAVEVATEPVKYAERVVTGKTGGRETKPTEKKKDSKTKEVTEQGYIDQPNINKAADTYGSSTVDMREVANKYTKTDKQKDAMRELAKNINNIERAQIFALIAMKVKNDRGTADDLRKVLRDRINNISDLEIEETIKYMSKI